jgi:transcriptional regulator with XRE-family HTH domain
MDALLEKERIAKIMFVLRTLSKRTQTRLTKALGVSFQQIQKYEKGLNGISSHHLFTLAKEQKWDIDLLFNGNPETMLASVPLKEQQRVAKKFLEIEANVREERKLQRKYAPLMPKLNRELAGENTFKDKELPLDAPIREHLLDSYIQENKKKYA